MKLMLLEEINIYSCKSIKISIVFLIIIKEKKNILNKLIIASELIEIYTKLYDSYRTGYTKPKFFIKKNYNYPINQRKKGICICSIGKDENKYIKEFVEYYQSLKIDKIIIFDNNDINGENFEDVLKYYIKTKFVDVFDVRGFSSIQIPIYNYCYQKYQKEYDWIGFFDLDEYLSINNFKNIKNYIYNKRFEKCQTIYFNMILYNDNDNLKYEKGTLIQRFTNAKAINKYGKSLVRGGYGKLLIPTTMIPGINIYYFCNSNGERIYPKNFYSNKYKKNSTAFLKHFITKTAEEFCIKINRGDAHFYKNHPKYKGVINHRLKVFFNLNKITKEKIIILENCTGIKLNKYRKKINMFKT